jgi:hypothetical protein
MTIEKDPQRRPRGTGVDKRVYTGDITADNRITDRGLRKWVASGRFPPPDGNLNGRKFWLLSTYQAWQADVVAGRYSLQRRPGSSAHAA